MKLNNKGAALMQVLLITIILAGMATMLLRASLSRTASARRMRRTVSAQVIIESCMAQVNDLWSKKSPEAFKRDMDAGIMYCSNASTSATATCPAANKVTYIDCTVPSATGTNYTVRATMSGTGNMNTITYEIINGSNSL